MNIDINTIALITLSAFTAFFGFGYIRGRIAYSFTSMQEKMNESLRGVYSEQDRIHERISRLEQPLHRLEERVDSMTSYSSCGSYSKKYANERPMHDKNYYNSEV